MNRTTRAVFLHAMIAAIALVGAPPGRAAEIENDGGFTIVVSFEHDESLKGTIPVPVHAPGAQAHYCAVFREFSDELYQTTEGRHYIKRVRLFEELKAGFRDVQWNYREPGVFHDSVGSYLAYLKMREGGKDGPDYYMPPAATVGGLGRLLDHEFGHYFYQLPDEYVNFKDYRGGGTGICADTYTLNGATATGTVCDEENTTCTNAPCVLRGQCVRPNNRWNQPCDWDYLNGDGQETACSENSANAGVPCVTNADCQPGIGTIGIEPSAGVCERGCGFGGICLGMNNARDDKLDCDEVSDLCESTIRICKRETNLSKSGGPYLDRVCLMRGAGYGRRWCDGGRAGDQQVAGASHNFVWPTGSTYDVPGNILEVDLGNTVGPPEPEITTSSGIVDDFLGHSCWASAAEKHVDLLGAHEPGDPYTDFDDGMGNIPIPEFHCDWLVDPVFTRAHVAVLIDKSISLGYPDPSDPPAPALDVVLDGALYLYNRIVATGDHAGVYLFDGLTQPATNLSGSFGFGIKTGEADGFDDPGATGGTDLAGAIRRAVGDMLRSSAPLAERSIVVVTDGRNNAGGDPYAETQRACDNGIFVWTVAYGDADSAALDRLSKCGRAIPTGTEEAGDPSFSRPDPLEIKTALARLGHRLAGDHEILEFRARLEPLTVSTVETRAFVVPQGAGALRFAWLANHTCAGAGPIGGDCEPVLNLLTAVELVSPGGTVFSAALSPGGAGGVYRAVDVPAPEPGTWVARIDKSEPVPALPVPGEWNAKIPATRVSWIGHVAHGGMEAGAWVLDPRRPLDAPVPIQAELAMGARLARIDALATVTHAGRTWLLRMYDDGLHFDGDRLDGMYGAIFNPLGDFVNVSPGLYRVKVRMESRQGRPILVPAGEDSGDGDELGAQPPLYDDPGHVVVEAETGFRLSSRYTADPEGRPVPGTIVMSCPDLRRGETVAGLSALVDGIVIDPRTTRISLGGGVDLTLTGASCTGCADTSTDPSGQIVFDAVVAPDAETGSRTFFVQEQFDIVRAAGACRICSQPGDEACDGLDNDCDRVVPPDEFDADGDGALACADCDDADPGVIAPPGLLTGLVVSPGLTGAWQWQWDSQAAQAGAGTVYDVFSGAIADVDATAGFSLGTCAGEDLILPGFLDASPDPAPGQATYFMFRGQNACGTATFGSVFRDTTHALSRSACR